MSKFLTILFSIFLTTAFANQNDTSEVATFDVQVKETRVLYERITASRIGDQIIFKNFRTNNKDFSLVAGTKKNARAICELQGMDYETYGYAQNNKCFGNGCTAKSMRTSVINGETGDIASIKTTSYYLTEVICKDK